LEIGRLRALLELARTGTMAAAAEALFLTPSAVSQQIAQLEEEAGVKLTERIGRGVRLTPAGHALVAHAERLMVVMDEARSEMAELRREIAGELRVAAFPSIASVVLPETVNALRRAFPRLEIVIEELEAIDGVAALRSWRTDIALIDDLSIVAGDNREHVTVVPLADVISVTGLLEQYRTNNRRLILNATSTVVSPNVVLKLQPYVTITGTTYNPDPAAGGVGNTFTNNGGGAYSLTLNGVPEPACGNPNGNVAPCPTRPLDVKSNLNGDSGFFALTDIRQ